MITPRVACLARDPFDREDWLFELKRDGLGRLQKQMGRVRSSSTRNEFIKRFPPIVEALAALERSAILDGEQTCSPGQLSKNLKFRVPGHLFNFEQSRDRKSTILDLRRNDGHTEKLDCTLRVDR